MLFWEITAVTNSSARFQSPESTRRRISSSLSGISGAWAARTAEAQPAQRTRLPTRASVPSQLRQEPTAKLVVCDMRFTFESSVFLPKAQADHADRPYFVGFQRQR